MAPEEILGSADPNRRDFLKKVLAGTTFAAPVLASFSMEGLSPDAAWAEAANCSNMTVVTSDCCRFAAEIAIAIGQLAGGCCFGRFDGPPSGPIGPGLFLLPPEILALLLGDLGKAMTAMSEGLEKGKGDCTNAPAKDKFKKAIKELEEFKEKVDELCADTDPAARLLKNQADILIQAIRDLLNGACASDGIRLFCSIT